MSGGSRSVRTSKQLIERETHLIDLARARRAVRACPTRRCARGRGRARSRALAGALGSAVSVVAHDSWNVFLLVVTGAVLLSVILVAVIGAALTALVLLLVLVRGVSFGRARRLALGPAPPAAQQAAALGSTALGAAATFGVLRFEVGTDR